MEKYQATELIKKILKRDWDRWLMYTEETGVERSAYKNSFPAWKWDNGFADEDAELIAELFTD